MKISSAILTELIALVAFVGLFTASYADSGTVTLTIYKAGWIIGGSGGSGTLNFHGRYYALSTGGYGLVFGGSKSVLFGRVSNINRPSDVAGVYGAAGAGLAVDIGAREIELTNQMDAVLELTGRQVGLLGERGSERTRNYVEIGARSGIADARVHGRHCGSLRGTPGTSAYTI
jgi:hypothetical protein